MGWLFFKKLFTRKEEIMARVMIADCDGCLSKASRCVVKTMVGAFIVEPSASGRQVCAPVSKKGKRVVPLVDECFGGVTNLTLDAGAFERNIITAFKTTKGVVHMELYYAHMDARLSPLSPSP